MVVRAGTTGRDNGFGGRGRCLSYLLSYSFIVDKGLRSRKTPKSAGQLPGLKPIKGKANITISEGQEDVDSSSPSSQLN